MLDSIVTLYLSSATSKTGFISGRLPALTNGLVPRHPGPASHTADGPRVDSPTGSPQEPMNEQLDVEAGSHALSSGWWFFTSDPYMIGFPSPQSAL